MHYKVEMKRYVVMLIVITMLTAIVQPLTKQENHVTVQAATTTSKNKLLYKIEDKKVVIYGTSDDNLTSLVIPSKIDGYPVTKIDSTSFNGCKKLKSVTVPKSIKEIGIFAFSDTPWLKAKQKKSPFVVLNGILIDASTAKGTATIPNGVTRIAKYAFYNNQKVTNIVMPDSVTYIEESAFGLCSKLKNVTFSKKLEYIGFEAFKDCTSLTKVGLHEGVKEIADRAFRGCNAVTSVSLPKSLEKITLESISDTKWYYNNHILEDQFIINDILVSCDLAGDVVIPDTVTRIADDAFLCNRSMTSVVLPDTVTQLGENMFTYCENLKKVVLPSNITEIPADAFLHCKSLTTITIPESVTKIAKNAFFDCTSLKKLTIPSGVKEIGVSAFAYTPWFEAKEKKDKMVIINNILLSGYKCTGKVTIPKGVVRINESAFNGNDKITSVTIPNTVKSIGDSSFSMCNKLTSITIPGSVETIGNFVFMYTPLKSVVMKNGVKSIGLSAFSCCEKLEKVTMPNTLISIDDAAFNICPKLKSLVLPKSIKSMGRSVFANSEQLSVTVYNGSYAHQYAKKTKTKIKKVLS